jgi:hypothetical protein
MGIVLLRGDGGIGSSGPGGTNLETVMVSHAVRKNFGKDEKVSVTALGS